MDQTPSEKFIQKICSLYGDMYDDRIENTAPPTAGDKKKEAGLDWEPGTPARHQSLSAFQKELKEQHGIILSTSKLRKILITGRCWTTKRSREVAELFEQYHSISKVAHALGVTSALVTMYLPYNKTVYEIDEKSPAARKTEKWREKK